ncbi:MAG: hypothetical protein HY738_04570 [Bacteroidia bacterium]|nr:hypothetical protein [Bacteroidia bacterium]
MDLNKKNEAIAYINNEKEELKKDYKKLLSEYQTLQTDNDTLNVKIKNEEEKIMAIMEELKTVKAENTTRIREYKNELNVLREIMKGYIAQIDSLNKLNQQLLAENIEVKSNFQEAKGQIHHLSKVRQELESKVTIGSVIQAKNIGVLLLNENDKVINKDGALIKARKVYKIKTNFTLRENPLAPSGERFVYLVFARKL